MDAYQLTGICNRHKHTCYYFGGVYAADTLPRIVPFYPIFYICNTALSYRPGKHWVLIFLPGNDIPEYFDSLGFPPEFHNYLIHQFLMKQGPRYWLNYIKVQADNTKTCGQFCLFVADMRCIGLNMDEIMELFYLNLNRNENLVTGYVNVHMGY
jgi:hypothetical protein